MARPNSPDMPPKRTKKVGLGIISRVPQNSKNAALHDSTFLQPLLLRERRVIFILRDVTLNDNRAKIAVHVFKLPGLTLA